MLSMQSWFTNTINSVMDLDGVSPNPCLNLVHVPLRRFINAKIPIILYHIILQNPLLFSSQKICSMSSDVSTKLHICPKY